MNADTPKRKNLGRGLNALFGEQDDAPAPEAGTDSVPLAAPPAVSRLPLDLMNPSPLQPRRHFDETALDELAVSIKEKGVLQPLLVRPDPHNPGHYEIIAGERRWRASQRANVHEVPAHVMDLSDAEVLEVALIENLQRQDLSPVEEARGYKRLMDEFDHTQEQLSDIVGRSRAHVANMLRLLSLPHAVLTLLDDGKLTVGQVRPLIGHKSAEALAQAILKRGLSARQAEKLARGYGRTRKPAAALPKDTDTAALEKSLEQATGYKIDIKFDGKGGSVTVAYASLEQLDDIVRRLSGGGRKGKPERDAGTVDLEELLSRSGGGFPPGKGDDTAAADGPREDAAADDVGAGGSLNH